MHKQSQNWSGAVPLKLRAMTNYTPFLPIYHQSPIFNFRKILHFQPCFGPEFQLSRRKISQIFAPKTPGPRPLFFQGKPAPKTTFENPRGTFPPKKVECPPRASRILETGLRDPFRFGAPCALSTHHFTRSRPDPLTMLTAPPMELDSKLVGQGAPTEGCHALPWAHPRTLPL